MRILSTIIHRRHQPYFGVGIYFVCGLLNARSLKMTSTPPSSTASPSKIDSPDDYITGTHSVAFITTPDEVTARKLATSLIQNQLAACVNIIPKIVSIYTWEGKMNEDNEVLMMIKTRTTRIDDISKFVRANHPYSVAEVISLPIENGNHPYLEWITKTVPEQLEKK